MTEDLPPLSQKTRWVKVAFQIAAGLAVILVSGYLAASLYYLVQNAEAGADTRKLLIECVVPPQERSPAVKVSDELADCYTRAQAQQGQAVASIGDVTIRAACATQFIGDAPGIARCVEDVTNYIKEQQP